MIFGPPPVTTKFESGIQPGQKPGRQICSCPTLSGGRLTIELGIGDALTVRWITSLALIWLEIEGMGNVGVADERRDVCPLLLGWIKRNSRNTKSTWAVYPPLSFVRNSVSHETVSEFGASCRQGCFAHEQHEMQ